MADNTSDQGGFNFSIQDSYLGDTKILDVFGSDSVTSNSDDLEKINDTTSNQTTKTPPKTTQETTTKKPEEDKNKQLKDLLEDEGNDDKSKNPTKEEDNKGEDKQESFSPDILAKDLVDLGILTLNDGEEEISVKTAQDLLERFQQEKVKGANEIIDNFIGQFGEEYQNAFQAIYVKGVDPKEYFTTHNNIEKISELDLTKEGSQEYVIRQMLIKQGFDEEDIPKEIERISNQGDLELTAKRFHKVLLKEETTKLQQLEQNREAQKQREIQVKQEYARNVANVLQDKIKEKSFDGLPINPKLATELQDFLLVDKWKTNSGETLTDFDKTILDLKKPENHNKKVKFALLLKILEKDPTLSSIQKIGVSKKTEELFGNSRKIDSKDKQKESTEQSSRWFQ